MNFTQCRALLEALQKGGVVSQGATRSRKDNPGSCRKRPGDSTKCSCGHGRVQTFQYKRTSSKREGASTDMYKRSQDQMSSYLLHRPYLKRPCGQRGSAVWKGEHELLQLPFTVVERTYVSCLEPARDAMEVECVLQEACNMINHLLLRV